MSVRQVAASHAVFGVAVMIISGCGGDAPNVSEPRFAGSAPATLLTAADCAAAIAKSSQLGALPANATTASITVSAGESIVVTILSTNCSGNPETVTVYGAITAVVASGACGSLPGRQVTLG